MREKARRDERVTRAAYRSDATDLKARERSERGSSGAGRHGMPTAGSSPAILRSQLPYLQRTAGNRAVQSLISSVQRLAYNEPIPARAVQTVFKVPGKSTYIVTGRDGSKVVVKFEPGSEAQAQKKARLRATNLLAKQILPNVPDFSFLTPAELTALGQLPDRIGQDAIDLKGNAAQALPGGIYVGLKLAFVNVGDSLDDMMKKAVPGGAGGGAGPGRPAPPLPPGAVAATGPAPSRPVLPPQVQTEAMGLLQGNPAIWWDLGRMAAFDLFVGNADRFHTVTPTVNFQNLDFSRGPNPSAVALDNFNPSASMFAMKEDAISFGKNFPAPLRKSDAVKVYARSVVSYITSQIGIDALNTYDDAFATGFHISRDAIKDHKANMKDAVTRATAANDQAQADYFSFLLARVKQMK